MSDPNAKAPNTHVSLPSGTIPCITSTSKRRRKRRFAKQPDTVVPPHLQLEKSKPGEVTHRPKAAQQIQSKVPDNSWDDTIGKPWHDPLDQIRVKPAVGELRKVSQRSKPKHMGLGNQTSQPQQRSTRWPSGRDWRNPASRPLSPSQPTTHTDWTFNTRLINGRRQDLNAVSFLGTWNDASAQLPVNPPMFGGCSGQRVREWCADVATALEEHGPEPTTLWSQDECPPSTYEVTPRYWIPIYIEGTSRTSFWKQFITNPPAALDDDDLTGVLPWWDRLAKDQSLLQTLSAPRVLGVDPDESLEETHARENDFGSIWRVENRAKARRASQRKQNRDTDVMKDSVVATSGRRVIIPGTKFVIRSARMIDVPPLRDIYNYYVKCTCQAPQAELQTYSQIGKLVQTAIDSNFPFLVAVQMGEKPKLRERKLSPNDAWSRPVIGFAFAEDYSAYSQYQNTLQVRMFVCHEHTRRRVATSLLDKMMSMIDTTYHARGGYDIADNRLSAYAPSRTVDNLIVHLPYFDAEEARATQMWLERWFQFEKVGDLKDIGQKFGRKVSLAILQRGHGHIKQ